MIIICNIVTKCLISNYIYWLCEVLRYGLLSAKESIRWSFFRVSRYAFSVRDIVNENNLSSINLWNVLINFRWLKLHSTLAAVTGHVNICKQILLWYKLEIPRPFSSCLYFLYFFKIIIFHFSVWKKNQTFEVHLHFKRIDISHFFLKILKLGQKAVFSECVYEILLCKDKTKNSRTIMHMLKTTQSVCLET